MMSLRELFSGLYKHCECGCSLLIPIINKMGNPARYASGHNLRLKGIDHHSWKFGRSFDKSTGYWRLRMPGYYASDKQGRIYEHIYFFQEYYKCCMLPWGQIHHKDWNTENNMPWNLMGLTIYQHAVLGSYVNISNRYCSLCKNNKTYIDKKGTSLWSKDGNGGWLCNVCERKLYWLKRGKKILEKKKLKKN